MASEDEILVETGDGTVASAVVISRGENTYTFSKNLLVEKSGYFQSKTNFLEKQASRQKGEGGEEGGGHDPVYETVQLPEEEVSDDALKVINCFFNGLPLPLSEVNVYETINAGMYLQLEGLASACMRFIRTENLTDQSNFAEAWILADRLGCRELKGHIDGKVLGPAEEFRRRRGEGEFDLGLNLHKMRLWCHQSVVRSSTNLFSLVQNGKLVEEEEVTDVKGRRRKVICLDGLFTDSTASSLQALFHTLNFIYSGDVGEILEEDVPEILRLSFRMGVHQLRLKMHEDFAPQTPEQWASMYEDIRASEESKLLDLSLSHLCRNFSQFASEIKVLRADHLQTVLKSDCVNAREGDLLRSVFLWADHSGMTRRQELPNLLQHIRRGELTQEEINAVLRSKYKKEAQAAFQTGVRRPDVRPKRKWPQRLVMVEQPHPRLPAQAETRRRMGVHIFRFGSGEWESHLGPELRRQYSVAFDRASSRLYFCEPRNGVDVSVATYSLRSRKPRKERAFAIECLGAHAHSVSLFSPANPEFPLLVTRAMPTKGEKASVLWIDPRTKRAKVTYEPVGYPSPPAGSNQDLPQGEVADAEKTEERTYEARWLFHPDRRRSLLFSAQFRPDRATSCTVCVLGDREGSSSTTHRMGCLDSHCGDYEASFGVYGEHIVRVGGWSYHRRKQQAGLLPSQGQNHQVNFHDLVPNLVSRGSVDLFDPVTFQHRKRLPNLTVPRDCCGVVEVNGDLYVVGGNKRGQDRNWKRNRKKKKDGDGRGRGRGRSRGRVQWEDAVRHSGVPVRSMEKFNRRSGEWEVVKCNFPHLLSGHVAAFVDDLPADLVKILPDDAAKEAADGDPRTKELSGFVRGVTADLTSEAMGRLVEAERRRRGIPGRFEFVRTVRTRKGGIVWLRVDAEAEEALGRINNTICVGAAGAVLFQDRPGKVKETAGLEARRKSLKQQIADGRQTVANLQGELLRVEEAMEGATFLSS